MPVDPVELARELIRAPSITPRDEGCQAILIRVLARLGFTIHKLPFGGIDNFYARLGTAGKNLCFAGHTDVVPPGDEAQWRAAPFAAEERDGEIVGRGAVDMKGGLAAMTAAAARFLERRPGFVEENSLSFLITGDEEGDAEFGTVKLLEWLKERNEPLDLCLVGEPTSSERLGDALKNGRRGSVTGTITVRGVQGHVAYPDQGKNAIHLALGALEKVANLTLDDGNDYFPPSSLQFTAIEGGTAVNVIPGALTARFNVRFNTENSADSIETKVRAILDAATLDYDLEMTVSGLPFLTDPGPLTEAIAAAVEEKTGARPEFSTAGGTSDARFIAFYAGETAEFGLPNATMHKIDERVAATDLTALTEIYLGVLERIFPV